VVARAYLDQLERDEALPRPLFSDVTAALEQAALPRPGSDLGDRLESLAARLEDDSGDALTKKRRTALAETLSGIAAGLH